MIWQIILVAALVASTALISCTSSNTKVTAEVELKYDNNSLKEYLPVSAPSFTGYLVSFVAPSNEFAVKRIRINGVVAAWGKYEDKVLEVQIWDKDRRVIYQANLPDTKLPVNPYDNKTPFRPETAWVDVVVPDVVVTEHFYIHIHSEDGRWGEFRMGADDSVLNAHSELTVRDSGTDQILEEWPYWKIDSSGHELWYGDRKKVNWMIRVIGQ
jgi:hypothetical protein